ncbi:glycosyltransferase [Rhodopirellula baltica]|uniref:Glycosyl transferase family protein n=1 Tax=Rhodopirellula baltica SWK14 TaxID=993516 RepID=L7C6U3_RHOBT|nr:glycosyltransferase family 2 protein [Rhodopirellula baltica]ELP29909.1 glycosyl transferase family protein [Rhodopirellula baltica SWK14]
MTIAIAFSWGVFVIVAIQAAFSLMFVVWMSRRARLSEPSFTPKAAIILCLRGADPFLRQCLQHLLNQDYPEFQLHVVVDSQEDPSRAILRDFESDDRVRVSVLHDPPETCSLKCGSIVQVIRELDPSFEVIALCDADTVPHQTWLAELAAPLHDPTVAVTTGNRWYQPQDPTGASLVRYLWNIPAAINMIVFRIAWGGSLLIRRQVIDEAGLLKKWSRAFCEDTMLDRVVRRHGYRQVFVPNVMVVNRETCTFSDLMNWVPRQLLTAKLYHSSWPATVGYGIISSAIPFLAAVVAIVGWMQSDMESVRVAFFAFLAFEISNVVLVLMCEISFHRSGGLSETATNGLSVASLVKLPFWIVVSQIVSPFWFCKCFLTTSVKWRGIVYHIRGDKIQRGPHTVYSQPTPETRSL